MTPAEIKRTKLYRTLAPCIVKKDREELARMLAMVDWAPDPLFLGSASDKLTHAFEWADSPQGFYYWWVLSARLARAGYTCW